MTPMEIHVSFKLLHGHLLKFSLILTFKERLGKILVHSHYQNIASVYRLQIEIPTGLAKQFPCQLQTPKQGDKSRFHTESAFFAS